METKTKTTKIWTETEIRDLMQTDDKALYCGLVLLFKRQTPDEQRNKTTAHLNSAGFNSWDARLLSSYIEYLKKHGELTERQKQVARNRIKKYTRQLTAVVNYRDGRLGYTKNMSIESVFFETRGEIQIWGA